MSRTNQLTNRIRHNNISPFHTYHRSYIPSFQHINLNHISIHNLSTHTTTTTTSIRHFSDRKSGSFTQPPKKHPKSSENEVPNTQESKPFNPILHSKQSSKTMQSSTKTRVLNGKTETTQRKTVSHNTQIRSDDNHVGMTFSQQMDKKTETDHQDPSKDSTTSSTQTYKRMDVKNSEGTDSHTEINSVSESIAQDENIPINNNNNIQFEIKPNNNYDIYTVGNPTNSEIEWRKSMMNPHALIIHPDRLLPVLHDESHKKYEKKGWGYWQRKIKQTFTSVRERIIGNETFNEYSSKIKERQETISSIYDTSQNYHLVKMRGMIDRLNMQTEASKAMQIIQDDFSDFWVEDFLPAFDECLCPLIVRAYLNDDLEFLNTICVGEAQVFCKNMIEQRLAENKMLAPDILWIHEADLIETKLHNKKPQLVIRAEVQCIDCVYERGTDKVVEGSPSTVATNIFVMVLEPNIDEEYCQIVPLPWQVRSLTTARQRQIV
eukprot:913872_1